MGAEWTPEQRKLAAKLFKDGYSSGQIAVQLGRTRNAVVGRLSRDGLIGDKSKHALRRATRLAQASAGEDVVPNSRIKKPAPSMLAAIEHGPWNPLPGTAPVPLEQVTGCRWPIGDPLSPDFCMCNAPRVEGSSYCGAHRRASRPTR